MRTITVGDLLNDGELDDVEHNLYIVRDGRNRPLYVGQSSFNVIERLVHHFGLNDYAPGPNSIFARHVLDHLPESESWDIELRTFDECVPLIKRHMPHCRVIERCTLLDAERALMAEFKPRFNRTQNPE